MCRLRCLIRRHNISKDISKKMNDSEDLFHSLNCYNTCGGSHNALLWHGGQGKQTRPPSGPTFASMATSVELHWNFLSPTFGMFVDNYIMPSLTFSLDKANETDIDDSHQRSGAHQSFLSVLMIVEVSRTLLMRETANTCCPRGSFFSFAQLGTPSMSTKV